MIAYENPIIPGFYPDPSVCKDGEDYYLVTSSFEYFPGIPLFHSRDLIHWEQIGHVLTRPSQLYLGDCRASYGIWAPTIRYHNGRFYVSSTNFGNGGNFYVWTDEIRGQWSEPVWVKQGGIDPSLFFDEDGTVYLTSTYDLPDDQAIGQCIIDIETGEMKTETSVIWKGNGGKYPEAPHMFVRNGWYYLLAAEGGTEYGHMVTISRGKSPWGPFENCPHNPILSHRDTMLNHFQAVGHGDFIETSKGDIWMVFHGIRTTQYMLHHIGRETMLAPVSWNEEGWPVVNEGKTVLPYMEVDRVPVDTKVEIGENPFAWVHVRNPVMDNYQLNLQEKKFKLTGSQVTLNDCSSPTFIGRRQQQFDVETQVWVDTHTKEDGAIAGITVYHTNEHHYDLAVKQQNEKQVVVLRKRVGDMETEVSGMEVPRGKKVLLKIEADKYEYCFYAGFSENSMQKIGTGRTQLLSTECMVMTFTGCFIGFFAEGNVQTCFEKWALH